MEREKQLQVLKFGDSEIEYVGLSTLPNHWRLMTLIRRGELPDAIKTQGRWFVPKLMVLNDDQE